MSVHWPSRPLSSLCSTFTDGDWIETKDQSPKGIRLVQTGNIGNGTFKERVEKARFISNDTFERLRCTEIFPGDCLISRLPDPVGRAAILPTITGRMITAVDCTVARFHSSQMLPEFFIYYSQSRQYFAAIDALTTGATRRRISRNNLGRTTVPVPSLTEQRGIVAILDETFEGIATATANAEKNLANARELFEAKVALLFAGNETWVQKPLGQIGTLQRGFDLPTRLRRSGAIPLVSSSGVIDRVNEAKVTGPGVATGRSGSIGNVFLVEDDFWPLNTVLYVKDFHGNDVEFVFRLLQNFNLGRFAGGTGVPTLNRNSVHEELVRVPTRVGEQRNVVGQIGSLEANIESLQGICRRKLALLAELKQSILHRAFNGDLTPAEALAA